MLKNDYLDAKIGVDTEENEPSKVLWFYLIFIPPRDLIFTYVYRPLGTVLLYGHLDKQPPFTGWGEGLGPYDPVVHGEDADE